MTHSIAVKASCIKCNADLEVGAGVHVNGRWMVVIQNCEACNPDPKKPKPKKPKVREPKDYVYGDRAK